MMFAEPRFPPLGSLFADGEEEDENMPKPRLVRRHSFAGYIPYHLDAEVQPNLLSLKSLQRGDFSDSGTSTCDSDNGSERKYESDSRTWQDESLDDNQAWPDTDDEWDFQAPARSNMPQDSQEVQMDEQIVLGLGKALAEATADDAQLTSPACFHSNTLHGSIESYVQQLHRRLKSRMSGNSRCWCAFALAYISKVTEMNPGQIEVNRQTVHRLVLAALTIAVKFNSDIIGNMIFTEVTGLPLEELDVLEAKFLELMRWQVAVDSEDIERMQELLCMAGSA